MRLKGILERPQRGRVYNDYSIIVAYDGERTEDDYFRARKLIVPFQRLEIRPLYVKSGGNPLKAVKECIKNLRKQRDYAEFWLVCDCDDTSREDIAEAYSLAEKNEIRLCLSKRCFELWIAMHFEYASRPFTNEQDAISNVQKHLPDYGRPRKVANFSKLFPKTQDAINNCTQLSQENLPNHHTKVHVLVRKLFQNLK